MEYYDLNSKTPNPFSDPTNPIFSNLVDEETINDAIRQLQGSYSLLQKAGAPKEQLNSLHGNIFAMKAEMDRVVMDRKRREQAKAEENIGPAVEDDQDFNPSTAPNCTGRKLFGGVLEKLQRGDGGFSALWKRRWVRVERGWLKCYATDCRPEPATKQEPEEQPAVFIGLTDKTTEIEPTATSAFRKKFGGLYTFTVASKDMFGTRRQMTFNCKTDKEKLEWIKAITKGIVHTKFAPTPSIFRSAQRGEFNVLKHLIVTKGKNVNVENRYGMTALGYAVIAAARAADFVSKGKVPEVPLQDVFQCVAFLMSKGANPTSVTEKGLDCFDLAKNNTEMVPRARRLLLKMLDSSSYMVEDGDVWLKPESEAKLRRRIEIELNGIMVEDVATNKEAETGQLGRGEIGALEIEGGVRLRNVTGSKEGRVRKTRILYSKKTRMGTREGYVEEGKRGGNRYHSGRTPGRGMKEKEGFKEDALWPEHHRAGREEMPLKASRGHVRMGRPQKDPKNALVQYYRSGIDPPEMVDGRIPEEERKKRDGIREEYLRPEGRGRGRSSRPRSAPTNRSYGKGGKYKPGYWTTELPKYGTYATIMRRRPRTGGGGGGGYSEGSYPGMFKAKDKERAARLKPRPSSAGPGGRRGRSSERGRGGRSGGRPQSAGAGGRRYVRTNTVGNPRVHDTNLRKSRSIRRDKRIAIDRKGGVQIGKKTAPEPRRGRNIGGEWFGDDHKPLRGGTVRNKSFPEQYEEMELEKRLRFKKDRKATFGTGKNSGTKQFRPGMNGQYAAGKTGFLHDQVGGNIVVAGSAALAAREKGKFKRSIKNKEALEIISNWHALGGTNIVTDFTTEGGGGISYDSMNDMASAFRMLQKEALGEDGDMLSCDYLRKVLTREAERLGEGEVDALISEADPEGTGFMNFKQFTAVIIKSRLPHLPKGSAYGDEDDIVMQVQRRRIKKEKAEVQRKKDLKDMGLGYDGLDARGEGEKNVRREHLLLC